MNNKLDETKVNEIYLLLSMCIAHSYSMQKFSASLRFVQITIWIIFFRKLLIMKIFPLNSTNCMCEFCFKVDGVLFVHFASSCFVMT